MNDKKPSILIIGAGFLQIPAIKKASAMGLFTIATDYNPDADGIKLADDNIIISTRDVDGTVREVKRYSESKRRIDGVITVGTDASMTVSAVANALGLPGIKFINAEASSNKLKMRTRLTDFGVPCPGFYECWTIEEALENFKKLNCTVVFKPADNMGSRGVSMASNLSEVHEAFNLAKHAAPSGEVIVEEFMEGPELSIDALIYNGDIHITGIADRVIDYPPYFVETGHIMPSSLSRAVLDDAVSVMKKGIKALGINLGAAKGDIKITKEGAKVGEIAARLSGGFMSAFTYPYATGVDLIGNAIRIAMGKSPEDLTPSTQNVSIESAILPNPGIVKKISGIEEALTIKGVNHVFLNVKIGDEVLQPKNNVEKAGNIIVTSDSRESAQEISKKALDTIRIITE